MCIYLQLTIPAIIIIFVPILIKHFHNGHTARILFFVHFRFFTIVKFVWNRKDLPLWLPDTFLFQEKNKRLSLRFRLKHRNTFIPSPY